jgi:hypothetical protein
MSQESPSYKKNVTKLRKCMVCIPALCSKVMGSNLHAETNYPNTGFSLFSGEVGDSPGNCDNRFLPLPFQFNITLLADI